MSIAATLIMFQAVTAVPNPCPETDGNFGAEIVVLDFDADGTNDLAVSAPGQGEVFIFFGGATPAWSDWQAIGASCIPDMGNCPTCTSSTNFGAGLAAGDLDGVAGDELVVGETGWNNARGRLRVYSYQSVGRAKAQHLYDLTSSVAVDFEQMGSSIAVGHFDDGLDGDLDVAAGASPFGDAACAAAGGPDNVGRVHVFYDSLGSEDILDNPKHTSGVAGDTCNASFGAKVKAAPNGAGGHDLFVSAQGNPVSVVPFLYHPSGGAIHVWLAPFAGITSPVTDEINDVNLLDPIYDQGARFGKGLDAARVTLGGVPTTVVTVGAPRKDNVWALPCGHPCCSACACIIGCPDDTGGAFVYQGTSTSSGFQLDPTVQPGFVPGANELLGFNTIIADVIGGGGADYVFVSLGTNEIKIWNPRALGSGPVVINVGGGYYAGIGHGEVDATNSKEELLLGDTRFNGTGTTREGRLYIVQP